MLNLILQFAVIYKINNNKKQYPEVIQFLSWEEMLLILQKARLIKDVRYQEFNVTPD